MTGKFLVFALLFPLIPLIALLSIFSSTTSNAFLEIQGEQLKEKSLLVGSSINRFLKQREHEARILSQADVFEGIDDKAISRYLIEIVKETPYIKNISLVDRSGMVVASSFNHLEPGSHILERLPALESLFNRTLNAKQGQVFVLGTEHQDKQPELIFLTPVTDETNSVVIRVLLIKISLEKIKEIVSEFNSRLQGNKYVYLVTNDGKVIVTPDPEVSFLSKFPDLSIHPEFLKKFSQQGAEGQIIYEDIYGDSVMAGYADMAEFGENKALDWSIVAIAPIAVVTSSIFHLKIILLIFTVISIVLGLYFSKTVYSKVKKAEEELKKLSLAVEQSPNAVFITDTEGTIEYINSKFTELTGYSAEEAIGENPSLIKSNQTPAEIYADLWDTIQAGKEWRGEIKDRRKDGRQFWVNETIAPVKTENGLITHYVATHEDISQRKEAELETQSALKQAEIANRAKSDLMANMSHELRTPLNAIIGFSSAMKEETFGPIGNIKYQEYLNDIQYSGQHLLDLINDILDVSAIEANALELHEETVSLANVIDASVRIIMPRADDGKVTVSSSITPELPLIKVDERRVKQVFLNLLSNAVKFTPQGGGVSVDAQLNENGSIAISVSDSGVGMDEDEVKKALSTFGQVDSGLGRKHEGTGLGLPLTLGLMELHGGALEVKSEKGHGTTITVTFPKERVIQNV